ncbi:hypothetical protein TYRP_022808 [Tyrophagus putrescentiae]|nr:hypothetical protein TYRP_022808 [Tyrophagus putrescentiae]
MYWLGVITITTTEVNYSVLYCVLPVLTYVHVSAVIWRSHKYPIGAKCLRVEGQKVRPGVVSPQLTPDPVVAVAPVEVKVHPPEVVKAEDGRRRPVDQGVGDHDGHLAVRVSEEKVNSSGESCCRRAMAVRFRQKSQLLGGTKAFCSESGRPNRQFGSVVENQRVAALPDMLVTTRKGRAMMKRKRKVESLFSVHFVDF